MLRASIKNLINFDRNLSSDLQKRPNCYLYSWRIENSNNHLMLLKYLSEFAYIVTQFRELYSLKIRARFVPKTICLLFSNF